MAQTKLIALEGDELEIISAHLQDAIIKIGDMSYQRGKQQFVFLANRFEKGPADDRDGGFRIRSALVFSRVQAVRSRKIRQGAPEAVLSLLSLEFEPAETLPQGTVKMVFSGGGELRLEVECVEALLEDLGERWPTKNIPTHDGEV